jgi:hypothetical protein
MERFLTVLFTTCGEGFSKIVKQNAELLFSLNSCLKLCLDHGQQYFKELPNSSNANEIIIALQKDENEDQFNDSVEYGSYYAEDGGDNNIFQSLNPVWKSIRCARYIVFNI